jgi:hypothetical protein
MSMDTGRIIAACFALAAFSVAIVAGLASGNDAAQILLRAVLVLLVCHPVGLVAGMICESVIRSHAAREPNGRREGAAPQALDSSAGDVVMAALAEPAIRESRAAA